MVCAVFQYLEVTLTNKRLWWRISTTYIVGFWLAAHGTASAADAKPEVNTSPTTETAPRVDVAFVREGPFAQLELQGVQGVEATSFLGTLDEKVVQQLVRQRLHKLRDLAIADGFDGARRLVCQSDSESSPHCSRPAFADLLRMLESISRYKQSGKTASEAVTTTITRAGLVLAVDAALHAFVARGQPPASDGLGVAGGSTVESLLKEGERLTMVAQRLTDQSAEAHKRWLKLQAIANNVGDSASKVAAEDALKTAREKTKVAVDATAKAKEQTQKAIAARRQDSKASESNLLYHDAKHCVESGHSSQRAIYEAMSSSHVLRKLGWPEARGFVPEACKQLAMRVANVADSWALFPRSVRATASEELGFAALGNAVESVRRCIEPTGVQSDDVAPELADVLFASGWRRVLSRLRAFDVRSVAVHNKALRAVVQEALQSLDGAGGLGCGPTRSFAACPAVAGGSSEHSLQGDEIDEIIVGQLRSSLTSAMDNKSLDVSLVSFVNAASGAELYALVHDVTWANGVDRGARPAQLFLAGWLSQRWKNEDLRTSLTVDEVRARVEEDLRAIGATAKSGENMRTALRYLMVRRALNGLVVGTPTTSRETSIGDYVRMAAGARVALAERSQQRRFGTDSKLEGCYGELLVVTERFGETFRAIGLDAQPFPQTMPVADIDRAFREAHVMFVELQRNEHAASALRAVRGILGDGVQRADLDALVNAASSSWTMQLREKGKWHLHPTLRLVFHAGEAVFEALPDAIDNASDSPVGLRVDPRRLTTGILGRLDEIDGTGGYFRLGVGTGWLGGINPASGSVNGPTIHEEVGLGVNLALSDAVDAVDDWTLCGIDVGTGLDFFGSFAIVRESSIRTHVFTSGLLYQLQLNKQTTGRVFIGGGVSFNAAKIVDFGIAAGYLTGADFDVRNGEVAYMATVTLPLSDYLEALADSGAELIDAASD